MRTSTTICSRARSRPPAGEGARLVCLQELTLSPYFAISDAGPRAQGIEPEALPGGPTHAFAAELAAETQVFVHASLYERAESESNGDARLQHGDRRRARRRARRPHAQGASPDHRGLLRGPLLPARRYRLPGGRSSRARASASPPAGTSGFPKWPAPALQDTEVLVYPTAIGSEPDHPRSTPNRSGSR